MQSWQKKSSVYTSTFYNYVVGLSVSVLALLILGQSELATLPTLSFSFNPLIYLGGLFGAAVVLICNVTVARVSAFYLTLLMFVGQIFSAIVFDMVIGQAFEPLLLAGGVLVALGLIVDLLIDRKHRPQDLP